MKGFKVYFCAIKNSKHYTYMEQDEVRIPTEMEWALWKQSAEDGNAEAQYQLGRCYANGLGVEIDMVEAVRWFTLAAEQGMAMAQCALGNCYYYGYGRYYVS